MAIMYWMWLMSQNLERNCLFITCILKFCTWSAIQAKIVVTSIVCSLVQATIPRHNLYVNIHWNLQPKNKCSYIDLLVLDHAFTWRWLAQFFRSSICWASPFKACVGQTFRKKRLKKIVGYRMWAELETHHLCVLKCSCQCLDFLWRKIH